MCKFEPQIIHLTHSLAALFSLKLKKLNTDMKIFENWNFLESYKKVCLEISFCQKSSITDVSFKIEPQNFH